jgi:hypothetical protein
MASRDEALKEMARRELARRRGGQGPEETSVASDMAQSGMAGFRRGIEGMIGAFGTANELQGNISEWAANKLGASPETAKTVGAFARRASLTPFAPSASEIQQTTDAAVGKPYEPQTTAGEYARTVGEFAPAAAVGPGSLGRRAAVQAILPALGSETAGQATEGTKLEPYARVAGALAGGLLPAAKRLVTPLPISPERSAMTSALAREGIELTAGQKTGSERLRYMESELGGAAGQRMMERQGEQFTRATLKRAGIDADRALPEVIDGAFKRIGDQFDSMAAKTKIPLDAQLQDDMLKVVTDYQGAVGTPAPALERLMNRTAELAGKNGVLEGEAYQNLRSEMGSLSSKADGPTKQALRELQDTLDDAVERNMPQQFMDAWREARGQYRNMLVIEKAATGAGEAAAQGLISPSQLRNATVQQSRRGYARGQGDFAELARSGEAVLKPLPQSGTAPRTAARAAFGSLPTVAGALAGNSLMPGTGALLGGAAGAAAPFLIGRALLGPARGYLGNQMVSSGSTVDPKVAAIIAALMSRREQSALPPAAN